VITIWCIGLVAFLACVSMLFANKWDRVNNPNAGTAVTMRSEHELEFPAITICNLSPSAPLTPLKCHSFDGEGDCPESHVNPYLSHCLVYNNDQNTTVKYSAVKKGLADALMIVLSINIDQ
jgi:hypothetical protein